MKNDAFGIKSRDASEGEKDSDFVRCEIGRQKKEEVTIACQEAVSILA